MPRTRKALTLRHGESVGLEGEHAWTVTLTGTRRPGVALLRVAGTPADDGVLDLRASGSAQTILGVELCCRTAGRNRATLLIVADETVAIVYPSNLESDMSTILDRLCPDEAHLPPSARTLARIIHPGTPGPVLELRDPNSGHASDPADKPRHQYLVGNGGLFRRVLPPAALDAIRDESPWRDTHALWELVEPGAGIPWEWAVEQGVVAYSTTPVRVEGEWDIHGDGEPSTVGYIMPPRHPWDIWQAVTGAACPMPGCAQTLVWYEAGYVPGYRACMRDGDSSTIRHRWLWARGVLVLDGEEE